MAAFTGTPVGTDSYTGHFTTGPSSTPEWNMAYGKWTHTATQGSGTGSIHLVRLPPGKIAVNSSKSRLLCTAMGAGALLDLGYRSYVTGAGESAPANDTRFAALLDSAVALDQSFPLPVDPISHFDTRAGLTVYATITVGNIESTDTVECWVAWKFEK